jgi:hypothetical protein
MHCVQAVGALDQLLSWLHPKGYKEGPLRVALTKLRGVLQAAETAALEATTASASVQHDRLAEAAGAGRGQPFDGTSRADALHTATPGLLPLGDNWDMDQGPGMQPPGHGSSHRHYAQLHQGNVPSLPPLGPVNGTSNQHDYWSAGAGDDRYDQPPHDLHSGGLLSGDHMDTQDAGQVMPLAPQRAVARRRVATGAPPPQLASLPPLAPPTPAILQCSRLITAAQCQAAGKGAADAGAANGGAAALPTQCHTNQSNRQEEGQLLRKELLTLATSLGQEVCKTAWFWGSPKRQVGMAGCWERLLRTLHMRHDLPDVQTHLVQHTCHLDWSGTLAYGMLALLPS